MDKKRHPRDELIEAVWTSESAAIEERTLLPSIQEHLQTCAECREFFDELRAMRQLVRSAPSEVDVTAEETQNAVQRAMRTAAALAHDESVSLREKAGFALMAAGMVRFHALLVRFLKPQGFFILEGLLNWTAPFIFYIIFRLSRRSLEREEGSA